MRKSLVLGCAVLVLLTGGILGRLNWIKHSTSAPPLRMSAPEPEPPPQTRQEVAPKDNARLAPLVSVEVQRSASVAPASPPPQGDQTNDLLTAAETGWHFRSITLPPETAAKLKEEQEVGLKEVVAKDIAEGINQEVRDREARLLNLADQLALGSTPEATEKILGPPDAVQMLVQELQSVTMPRTNAVGQVPLGTRIVTSYWPRVGVPFDGHNGQGYHVLYLVFGPEHRLKRWFWDFPVYHSGGSLQAQIKEKDYWEGKHAVSGPPPDDI